MSNIILQSDEFQALMKRHVTEVIELFLVKQTPFSIVVNLADLTFSPSLPEAIMKDLNPITMFFLAGYTFESTHIHNDMLNFEAGFGSENFGSFLSIPISAILQIILDEMPVFINLAKPIKPIKQEKVVPKEEGAKRSMSALMANPKNKGLIKS